MDSTIQNKQTNDLANMNAYLETTLAGIFAFILIYSFLQRNKKGRVPGMPPTAPGGWPMIGHLHLLAGGAKPPHVSLGELADTCGPIFTIRLGIHRAVVVSSWEMAKECYTTHDFALTSRPEFTAAKHLAYNYALFAFTLYGAYWREIRKIATVELLSTRRIAQLKHVCVSEVETLVKGLHRLWREKKDFSRGRVPVELKEWFSNMSLNIIVRIVAGKRYDMTVSTANNPSSDEIKKRRCLEALRQFFEYMGTSVASDAFPFLERLDIGGHIKEMKRVARDLDSMLSEWLHEHREKTAREEHDFMDAMISAVHGTELAGYDVDTVIKSTCLALIAGATDTSSVTLTWTISLLLNNPHTLKKAQQELDAVVGKERPVKDSDISKLVYLQAVVKESLRLYTPTPLLAPRIFTEDCSLGGYRIPKGTRLIPNVWKIQNDPRVWSDPSIFEPERFLSGSHKDVDLKGQHFIMIPFGSGRRGCPGSVFGLQVVHLALASFLQGFEISTPSNVPVDMTESAGLTNMKATPLEVLLKPRIDIAL